MPKVNRTQRDRPESPIVATHEGAHAYAIEANVRYLKSDRRVPLEPL